MVFRVSLLWILAIAVALTGALVQYVTGLDYLDSCMVGCILAIVGGLVAIVMREIR